MDMQDKKLALRVVTKLFALVAVAFVAYIFFAGFVDNSEETLVIDVNRIAPGEVEFFSAGKRRLLVLHRSPEQLLALQNDYPSATDHHRAVKPEYFVSWAYDPFFGCAIEYRQIYFKSICVNKHFDLSGRVFKGESAEQDLIVPVYQFLDDSHIQVSIDD
ncbi:MAG: hypothetical protein EP315_02500 [Gammaproteobacteria bacterium]|nr:MAG: hypothetical protein EP315_02500 [Gammaproteobacteria bacterium]